MSNDQNFKKDESNDSAHRELQNEYYIMGFWDIDPWSSGNMLMLQFIGRGFESQSESKVFMDFGEI